LPQDQTRITRRGGDAITEQLNELLPVELGSRLESLDERRRGVRLRGHLIQLSQVGLRLLGCWSIGSPDAAHRCNREQDRERDYT
jgi:hypothetical protein